MIFPRTTLAKLTVATATLGVMVGVGGGVAPTASAATTQTVAGSTATTYDAPYHIFSCKKNPQMVWCRG
ncbi:MAG TPA: hypothetical protein H9867_06540 [Candidatus Corynebacterium gallistercoris]|uniref:Uncharacterized protein n=1 Tax=Candidatus Corynebacterium gallistercoris TaxID=2838530 RepID=A0A9D1RYJ4_9CORY|nr:hypothetical protein [Candidatus Corynebacterium gallistercoris]